MSIYRLPLGQYEYAGHVINLPQDVVSFAQYLSAELDASLAPWRLCHPSNNIIMHKNSNWSSLSSAHAHSEEKLRGMERCEFLPVFNALFCCGVCSNEAMSHAFKDFPYYFVLDYLD